MKKLFLIFAAILMSASIFAQSTSVTLTPEQIAKLDPTTKAAIAALQTEARTDQIISTGSKWVGLGKEIASAVNETAKGVAMTASDFAETPLGKYTLILIAYKVIGTDLIQIVFGILWLIIIICISLYLYRNNSARSVIIKRTWNKEFHKFDKTYQYVAEDNDWRTVAIVIFCVGLIFTPLILFV